MRLYILLKTDKGGINNYVPKKKKIDDNAKALQLGRT